MAARARFTNYPVYRPQLTLRGHTDTVYSVAFAADDGRRLASGSYDQTVKLWDLTTGSATSTLHDHHGSVSCLTFAAHRHWLATGSNDHRVRFWRLLLVRQLLAIFRRDIEAHSGAVYSVAFSPDERWLISGGTDSAVRLFDLDQPRRTPIVLNGHSGHVYQVAVSPTGRWLASASLDNTIALWDLSRLTQRETQNTLPLPIVILRGHRDGVTSVAFSPDGKRLASGSYDQTVKLWDLSLLPFDLTTLRYPAPVTLRAHDDCIQSVAFAPDGRRLISASSDYTLKMWQIDTARPELSGTLRGHTDKVHTVAFSADGARIASGGKDRAVIIWQAN